MKKKFTLIVLLSCFITGFSQDVTDSISLKIKDKTPVHLREVPRHNLVISGGILQPLGDYDTVARSGLNIQLGYDRYLNKNFAITTNLSHSYNEFFAVVPDEDVLISRSANNFSNTSIDAGIMYTLRDNRFQFDSFVSAGAAFLNNPRNHVLVESGATDLLYLTSNNAASDRSALYAAAGVRFNYYFRKQVQLFFSPSYSSTLGDPLVFENDGSNQFSVDMSNLHFNIGVKIALGKTYSNGEQRIDD
jgi:hypothetical protein